MSTVLASIGSYLGGKALKVVIAISIMTVIFTLIPYRLELPSEVYNMFMNGTINKFFSTLYYFIPVDFLLKCILCIFVAKFINVFFDIVQFVWSKFIK